MPPNCSPCIYSCLFLICFAHHCQRDLLKMQIAIAFRLNSKILSSSIWHGCMCTHLYLCHYTLVHRTFRLLQRKCTFLRAHYVSEFLREPLHVVSFGNTLPFSSSSVNYFSRSQILFLPCPLYSHLCSFFLFHWMRLPSSCTRPSPPTLIHLPFFLSPIFYPFPLSYL